MTEILDENPSDENPSIAQMKTLALVGAMEARAKAATEGPWYREYTDVVSFVPDPKSAELYDDPANLRIMRGPDHLDRRDRQGIANAEFFVHSREDVLFLADLVKKQAEQLANVRSVTAEIGASENFLNVVIARGLRRALGDEPEPIWVDENGERVTD